MYVANRFSLVPIFMACILFPIYLQGQIREYPLEHLSTSDGLSQSSVIAIAQDSLGQLWFGTRDGLNKYDGRAFTVFRNDPNDSTSISNSDILAIREDSKGYLWIGTYNGLNRYDPQKNTFKRYFHSYEKNSLSSNAVMCITEMKNGEIWVGTSDGLSIYDREKDRFTVVRTKEYRTVPSLPSNYILEIVQLEDGTAWLGTSKGLCKVVRDRQNNILVKSFPFPHGDDPLFIQDITVCGENMLCLGTKNGGLLKFDTASETFVPTEETIATAIDTDVRAMSMDNNGKLWVGTATGIHIVGPDGIVTKVKNEADDPRNPDYNYIKSIFTDKKGSVWIGSYYGGIDIWDDSNTNFINYQQNFAKNSLGYNVVSSIVADTAGKLYFGTEGGGITIFDVHNKHTKYLNRTTDPQLPTNNIKALLLEKNLLWIGTFNKGLVVYDVGKKRFVPERIGPELRGYLAGAGVYAIKSDVDGNIWLGTFGKGLVRYDPKSRQFQVFENEPYGHESLSNNRIRTLLIDNSRNIWVGTENGLSLLKYGNDRYHPSQTEHFFFNRKTLSGDDILTLFQDSRGTLWVGTRAKGLFQYNGKDFEPRGIDCRNEISSIAAILEDDGHKLWMSSNHGIVKYDPVSGNSIIFDQKDGLVGNEFNNDACLKLGKSQFYFGGPSGVTSFDTKKFSVNRFAPQVILTEFKISSKSVRPLDGQQILDKSITFTEAVTLSYDKANFSINYAIPNFINSNSNQYRYRLVGLEDKWNTTTETQVHYTLQKPGEYLFEVKGANNDGIWNADPTRLKIIVRPAPWRSGWAFALYGLVIMAAVIGLGWIIDSKARLRHQLELEHLESKRNEEIHAAKLQFFTNISHEFRTPLTLITGPLQQILEDYRGSSMMYKKLLVIESNAKHLLQLINRLMDFRKLENKQFQLEAAEGNIVKFLREIFFSFSEYAKSGDYTYTFHTSSEEIRVYYDRNKLEQVFYNLISNAFRYTPKNGNISLRIKEKKDGISIQVEDTGTGIPKEFREKIFDRFFEIPRHKNAGEPYNKGTGIGLSIVKNIVDLHKGTVGVKSKAGQGTTFFIKLPLGKDHLTPAEIIKDFKYSDDIALYSSQLTQPLPEVEVTDLILETDKETILVVEDNVPLRSFMRGLLKDDYNVLEASDGNEALSLALQKDPDLIVSDVIMPNMVGTELCAKIKENLKTSHIPVVLLTSRTSLIYKLEGLESGADDYLSKPFDIKEFKLRIKNLLESSKRLKEKFLGESDFPVGEMVSSLDEKLMKKALQIVEENIGNDQFDIPTFSEELGVSRTLLFSKIKAWTQLTPNEFIQEIRMKRAAQLLEKNKLNISEVSYMVGFKNPKYFSKCFYKKYGETPSHFMEKFSEEIFD